MTVQQQKVSGTMTKHGKKETPYCIKAIQKHGQILIPMVKIFKRELDDNDESLFQ